MKFSTVILDCPWRYPSPGWLGGAKKHYETLPPPALMEMPIPDILEPNAHVWLWATDTFIDEACRMLEVWGLTRRSTFPWIKLSPRAMTAGEVQKALEAGKEFVFDGEQFRKLAYGNGYYGHANPEYLLFATRGKENITLQSGRHVRKLIEAPMSEEDGYFEGETFYAGQGVHSAKPERAYEIAAGMSPESRLDIFARDRHPGWCRWGREAKDPVLSIDALDDWSGWARDNYQQTPE